MTSTRRSNTGWYIAAAIIIIVVIVVGVLAYQYTQPSPSASPSPSVPITTASPSETPSESASPSASVSGSPEETATATASPSDTPAPSGTVTIDIYGGEVSASSFGFGTTASNITSPGPTITLRQGDTVTINFHNNGTMGHNVAVVTARTDGNTDLAFTGAQVASASNPTPSGGTGTCTFTVDRTGTFYYICQVDAHVSLGMWGQITVTS